MLKGPLLKRKTPRLLATSATLALCACTISPRDPLTPVGSEGQKEADASAKATSRHDEEFTVPAAERVTDSPEANAPSQRQEGAPPRGLVVGSALLTLGEHPPFSEPEAIKRLPRSQAASHSELPQRWQLKKTLWVGHGYIEQAQFTPDQKGVVTLSTDTGSLYHFDVESGRLLREIKLPNFEQFEFASFVILEELKDRTQIVVARESGTSVLDLESGQFDPLSKVPPGTDASPTGIPGLYGISLRTTTPQSGTLTFEWLSQGVAATLVCDRRPDGWSMTRDGRWLAVSYYPGEAVEVLDLKEQKLAATLPLPKWGSAVAFSPDGSLLALGGEKLRLIRFPSGEVIAEDTSFGNNVSNVRFTPAGDLLLVAAFDGKARSYALPKDLSTLTKLPAPQLLPHNGQANVYALGLSEDTRLLVTSSGDKSLKIWRR